MKKSITFFTLTSEELGKEISFSTTKQATEHQAVLLTFGVKTELSKVKKVIEL